MEGLLSGGGLHAGDALPPVPLSPPQPAVAEPLHGERYEAVAAAASVVCACVCVCVPHLLLCVCAGYQLRASIYSYSPADSQSSTFALDASIRSAEALSGEPVFPVRNRGQLRDLLAD